MAPRPSLTAQGRSRNLSDAREYHPTRLHAMRPHAVRPIDHRRNQPAGSDVQPAPCLACSDHIFHLHDVTMTCAAAHSRWQGWGPPRQNTEASIVLPGGPTVRPILDQPDHPTLFLRNALRFTRVVGTSFAPTMSSCVHRAKYAKARSTTSIP